MFCFPRSQPIPDLRKNQIPRRTPPMIANNKGTRKVEMKAKIASISTNLNSVSILNEKIFKDWKENIEIVLGCMDFDIALKKEQSVSPTESTTSEERKNYEKWDRFNRIGLMIIKRDIS
ncbi:hypothetical protein KIW84_054338 [Lathyrus oleraceus]|uniref:Uncharacterized protein n=1 Tax=Pisum sativum TaxID=3888 RepID=A0A9D4WXD9_PEA|nr:hypothetical protein KIW84_054338 [Pisum sativum]